MKEIVFRKRSLWFLLISFVMGFYVLNGNLALASGQEMGGTPYSTLKEQNIKRGIPLIDFEGDIRVSGPAPDIGADEYVLKSKSMPWMLLLWSDDES
jgi:hypothetical protein